MAVFCCFILPALFSGALTQPVNDEFQFDPFHHQQLNYTNLGLKETLELLKMFVNTAESKRVRRAATPGNLLSVIGGGEKLVKLFEILGFCLHGEEGGVSVSGEQCCWLHQREEQGSMCPEVLWYANMHGLDLWHSRTTRQLLAEDNNNLQ